MSLRRNNSTNITFSTVDFIVVSGQLSDKALEKYLLLILRQSFLVIIISPLTKMKRSFMQSMFRLLKAGDSLNLHFIWRRIVCFSLLTLHCSGHGLILILTVFFFFFLSFCLITIHPLSFIFYFRCLSLMFTLFVYFISLKS